jgi:hypothetical protein
MASLRKIALATSALALMAIAAAPAPQTARAADENAVEVTDQVVAGGLVVVKKVSSAVPGFIVIHAGGDGFPVIGQTYVPAGTTENVVVWVTADGITPQMSAMLHIDAGEAGVYEFPGADVPVPGPDGKPINPGFNALAVAVDSQFVTAANEVTIARVVAQQDGYIVIHSGGDGTPAIGQAPITAGINENVVVVVDPAQVTTRMTAMIHIDGGEIGKYEFPGPDAPANIEGMAAPLGGGISNEPFWTKDYVRARGQVVGEDGMITVPQVLASADGWLVIHASSEGFPGIGQAPVKAGMNKNVKVKVDVAALTPEVLAMLHIDAGTIGTYEFPGPDAPVMGDDGKPIAPAMFTGNGVRVADAKGETVANNGFVVVPEVVSAQAGWLVIHATSEGFPGIGQQYVQKGWNPRLIVKIDTSKSTPEMLGMLHFDDGVVGTYEFPVADAPVMGADGKPIAPAFKLTE